MKNKTVSNLLIYAIPILIVVGLIYLVVNSSTAPKPGENVPSLGNQHIDSVESSHKEYNSIPPTSGPHTGSKARWGVQSEQLPDEMSIHNLEDGGVIIHYGPEVSEEDIVKMAEIVNKKREGLILQPYAGMETKIALTAWGKILKLDSFDEDQIEAFIRAYEGIDHHQR